MADFQIVNFLDVTLAAGVDAIETEIVVEDLDLPLISVYDPMKTLSLTIVGERSNEHEIVYVTARVGTKLTVLRGRDGSLARAHAPGARVVAATNKEVLQQMLSAPTNAGSVAFTPNAIIAGGTVQAALDNVASLLVGNGLEPPVQAVPEARIMGETLGTTTTNVNRFDEALSGVLTTGGLSAVLQGPVVPIGPLTGAKSLVLIAKAVGLDNLDYAEVRLRYSAGGYRTVKLLPAQFVEGDWRIISIPMSGLAAIGGVPSLVDATILLKDDGTGPTTLQINKLLVFNQEYGSAIVLRKVSDAAGILTLVDTADHPATFYAVIDTAQLGTVFGEAHIQMLEAAGIGVVLTTSLELQNATYAQCVAMVYDALRKASSLGFAPVGFLYPGGFYGSLVLEPTKKVYDLISRYFARGFRLANGKGFSGQEYPLLISGYATTPGEDLLPILASPYESQVFGFLTQTDVEFKAQLSAIASRLRERYAPAVDPAVSAAITKLNATIAALPVIRAISLVTPANGATDIGNGGNYTFVAQAFVGDNVGYYSNYGIPLSKKFVRAYEPGSNVVLKEFSDTASGPSLSISLVGSGLATSHLYEWEFGYTDLEGSTVISPRVQATTAAQFAPAYGQAYEGGYLAFDRFGEGLLYDLVVAAKSTEVSRIWDTNSAQVPSRITGGLNTDRIAASAASNSAADTANDLVSGGKSDWFLPAIDQARAVSSKLRSDVATAGAFQAGGAEAFVAGSPYYSSTERDGSNALHCVLSSGVESFSAKTASQLVRAIRRVPVALPYAIGAAMEGGYLGAYFTDLSDGTAKRYMLILADRATEIQKFWKNANTLGSDLSRTNGQLNAHVDAVVWPASGYCEALDSGGKTDWYLPSIDELLAVFSMNASIPAAQRFTPQTGGGTTSTAYWASTESTAAGAKAIDISVPNNPEFVSDKSTSVFWVRPVRRVLLP